MIKELIFESPINNLSLGNVGLNILHSLYKLGIKVYYIPIGQVDINNYNLSDDFKAWLQDSAIQFLKNYKRDLITIKNWHINQSWNFPSDNRYLLTYHETDSATQEELQILKSLNRVFFCGEYSSKIFSEYGATNIDNFNLGFDNNSFYKTDKKYFDDNRIQWFLNGKLEKRKHTLEILQLWAKKFGKKQGESYSMSEQPHFLNCCIINPFYDVKVQEQQIVQALGGVKYNNIQFFSFLPREAYNDLLNASDIDLTGLSGGESWNLPAFNMTCLGKWSIVLNCSGHKSWANKDNCILINPNGKQDSTDNIHFVKGNPFNQGNFYSFNNEEVINAFEIAAKKARTTNFEGEKMKEMFTYDKSLNYILSKIN